MFRSRTPNTIRIQHHCPILRGREDLRTHGSVAIDDDLRGMAEAVVAAGADDDGCRAQPLDERARARCGAAVVRDLQNREAGRIDLVEQTRLGLFAGVAGKDDRDVAEPDLEDDGIVVAHALPFPFRQRWMEDAQRHLPHQQFVSDLDAAPLGADRGRGLLNPLQRLVARNRNALPDGARAEPRQHGGGAADVVRVGVRQHERVERAHSECAQRWRDNALADIKGGTVGRILERRRRETAGVHEKRAAIREHQERRIALTNVEEHHAQSCGAGERYGITRDGLRSGNNHDRDECRGRGCEPRHAQPQQSHGERQIVGDDDSPRGGAISRQSHGMTSTRRAESMRPRPERCTT